MKKYEVKCNGGVGSTDWGTVEIEAENFTVDGDGVLVFWCSIASGHERVAAFAAGQWVSVREMK